MRVIADPSSGWPRPLVASVTRQAALNHIRDSDFEGRGQDGVKMKMEQL